ncbi:MAG: PilZ domain-containing protein [Hyphomicrobiaceae bacterium]
MNFVFVEPERPARKAQAESIVAQLPVVVAQAEAPSRPAAAAKPSDNRRAHRKPVKLPANISDASQSFGCTVVDMSATGARLELHRRESRRHGGDIELPQRFFLVMENLLERSVVECYVMWHRGSRAGVQFIGPIDSRTKKLPQRKATSAGKEKAKAAPASLRRR